MTKESKLDGLPYFEFGDVSSVSGMLEDEKQRIVTLAIAVIESRWKNNDILSSPCDTRRYLRLQLAEKENEVFAAIFLDNQNRVICYEELFYGTIHSATVYPRVIVQKALKHNAAAIILAHNHPSGLPEPSHSDIRITERIREAMDLVDVRVLDHVVVSQTGYVSLAERGVI